MLRFTLIADGSSDKVLMNIIKWSLDDLYPKLPNAGTFADFRHLQTPPANGDVGARIKSAQEYFPSDLIFYHRDAEEISKDIITRRKFEITDIVGDSSNIICVVPKIMMESWLLFDSEAIKKAAGNRNYKGQINLPGVNRLEIEKNPKLILHALLQQSSGLRGRNLKKFNIQSAVHLVAENINDFSVLRNLSAFAEFEKDLKASVDEHLNA